MRQRGTTIKQAAQEWVGGFNAIPQAIVEKLLKADDNDVIEITPPSKYDRVCIFNEEHDGEHGEIVSSRFDGDDELYEVHLDYANDGDNIVLAVDEFDVERDGFLPMWGTMWSFDDSIDNYWLSEKEGLQIMADCGFRIYEQEDYEYIFGIDGAGYDFYDAHWIPLYRARGLHWHDESTEDTELDLRKKLAEAFGNENGYADLADKLVNLPVGESVCVGGYYGHRSITDKIAQAVRETGHYDVFSKSEVVVKPNGRIEDNDYWRIQRTV